MPLEMGWREDRRLAFQAELQQVAQCVRDDPKAPRLHVLCTVDPGQPQPPKPNGAWKGRVCEALLEATGAGALQLMAEGERVGRGVVVKWLPATNEGSLPWVNQGGGYLVVQLRRLALRRKWQPRRSRSDGLSVRGRIRTGG